MVSRRTLLRGGVAAGVSMVVAERAIGVGRSSWPSGFNGAVSITYDDGLDSQLDVAVPTLNALGLKATFFVTMKNIGRRLPEWATLPAMGHELADHTMDHPCDLGRYAARAFVGREIEPMEQWLDEVEPGRADPVYAYPCDVRDLGPGSPNVQARRYARLLRRAGIVAARTSEGEPNNPATLGARAYRLQALAVGYDAPEVGTVMNYLNVAERRGHWAILVFHGIGTADGRAGIVSPTMHADILDSIKRSRLWAMPMSRVLASCL